MSEAEEAMLDDLARANPVEEWVKAPRKKRWKPEEGEVLEGTYLGTETTTGQFGPYRKYLVRTANMLWFVTGVDAEEAFAAVLPQTEVQVVCSETKTFIDDRGEERVRRGYDVYVRKEKDR